MRTAATRSPRPPATPLTAPDLVCLLRRTARRLDERGGRLARLSPYGTSSGRRSLRRRAASYAADAQHLRELASQLARDAAAGTGDADSTDAAPLALAAGQTTRWASRVVRTTEATGR